jgi:hypothetical protein
MTTVFLILISLAIQETDTIDLKGKWGIGCPINGFNGEYGIMRGITSRTLVIGGFSFDLTDGGERLHWNCGLGFRRFVYRRKPISPYWGVSVRPYYYGDEIKASAFLDAGVEFFINDYLSLAMHSWLMNVEYNGGDQWSLRFCRYPGLFARLYF